jgi:polar amino acid transport system substrate-binding protein
MSKQHRRVLTFILMVGLCVLAVASVTACGGSSSPAANAPSSPAASVASLHNMLPDAIKSAAEIKVGINGIYAPMEYKDPSTNQLVGLDVDLANAIGQRLGVKITFDDQQFDQLINSVTTGRDDMVLSGMSDSVERQKTLDFVDYFNSGTQAFTTKELSSQIKTLADLSGKTCAVSASTDFYTTMEKWSKDNLEAQGKPGIKMLGVDSEASATLQIKQGRAQASAISPEVLGYMEKQTPGQWVSFGEMLAPAPYGIAFDKNNTQLRDAVQAAIQQMIKDGSYKAILNKWNCGQAAVQDATINGSTS